LPLVNDVKKQEFLIQDSTKYNLVEFTVSWCQSCRRIEPTLKEIDKKYGKNLIITYVTIDDSTTIEYFRDYVAKEKITNRCLWVENQSSWLFRMGRMRGVPLSILVHPDGKIDYLNLLRSENLQYLKETLSESSK